MQGSINNFETIQTLYNTQSKSYIKIKNLQITLKLDIYVVDSKILMTKILPEKNRPKWWDASTTARYPAIFAIELRASYTWALEILGIQSIAKNKNRNNRN